MVNKWKGKSMKDGAAVWQRIAQMSIGVVDGGKEG